MVLIDSQWFSVVLSLGSRRFSMVFRILIVFSGSRSATVVLCCSHSLSYVLSGSCRFSVFT